MGKQIKKRRRVAKRKNRLFPEPEQENRSTFTDYREQICDKCGTYAWTDQNKHYCGGNLL